MKRLLNKIFDGSPEPQEEDVSLPYPPLPRELTWKDTKEQAAVGFLAKRTGEILELEPQHNDALFYHIISDNGIHIVDTHSITESARALYQWMMARDNVWRNVQKLHVPQKVKKALLTAYEEFREDEEPAGAALDSTDEENALKEVYRDVIYASSQKKFLLILEDEREHYLKGTVLYDREVLDQHDVSASREASQELLKDLGIDASSVMSMCLALSEAVTNILKHAEKGRMLLIEDSDAIKVVAEDYGSGFPLKDLPYSVLMGGYSTKKSLGQGFTLMMRMADHLMLYTSAHGSTLILSFTHERGDPDD